MGFSIEKLIKLLSTRNFVCKKFYKINGRCAFVEVLSMNTADTFLLRIPRKYDFNVNQYASYKLKHIILDKEDEEEILNEYAGEPDLSKLEKDYESIELDSEFNKKDFGDIKNRLEEHYKRSIHLRDLDSADSLDVKCVFRQIRRLRYCVQNLRYKIVIFYKKYVCIVHSDDKIECFYIKKMDRNEMEGETRKVLVVVDLTLLYENMDIVHSDIIQIKEGIKKILDKNHRGHAKSLHYMMEKKSDIIKITDMLYNKKESIRKYIDSFKKLLEDMNQKEQKISEQIESLNHKREKEMNDSRGLKYDIQYSHHIKLLTDELSELHTVKENIVSQITDLKNQEENLSLIVDKILFDNTVMLDKIFKNLSTLEMTDFVY